MVGDDTEIEIAEESIKVSLSSVLKIRTRAARCEGLDKI